MNLNTDGARKRPKLSLPFGGRQSGGSRPSERSVPEITDLELRRLVASMID
jgi:hypothetical protein